MKEKRQHKRFDLFSTLAVIGVLVVLVLECLFVFEVYNLDFVSLNRFFPSSTPEHAPVSEPFDGSAPVG